MDFKTALKEADRLEREGDLLAYQSADKYAHAKRIRRGVRVYQADMQRRGFPQEKEPTTRERLRVSFDRVMRLFSSDKSREGAAA